MFLIGQVREGCVVRGWYTGHILQYYTSTRKDVCTNKKTARIIILLL